jgi:hypothetical protein
VKIVADAKLSDRRVSHAQTTWAAADIFQLTTAVDASKVMRLDNLFASIPVPALFKSADGINFDTAAGDDSDIDILTLDVTGTPKLWWDESVDAFSLSKPLWLGGVQATQSLDPMVNVNRAVDGAVNSNGHCFSDSSTITRGNGTAAATAVAYNSFDARVTSSGTEHYNHYCGFQYCPTIGTSGTTLNLYGLYCVPIVNTGTVTNNYGVVVQDPTGTGIVTNNYGIFVAEQTKGATINYAIYTFGASPCYFVGGLSLGIAPLASTMLRIGGASTTTNVKNVGISLAHTYTGAYLTGYDCICASAGAGAITTIFSAYIRPNHGSSSTLDSFYGIYSAPTSSGGLITQCMHIKINDVVGGTLTNQYGLYVAALAKGGTLNYAIYTAGATPSCHEGPLHFINVSAPTALTNGAVLYAADQASGNSCIHAKTEGGGVVKLYQQIHIGDLTTAGADAGEDHGARDAINALYVVLENNGLLAAT